MGNSVTRIGIGAFADCTSLTNVPIPNSVTEIGSFAFSFCTNLISFAIPNSVAIIGDRAFSYCSGLNAITVDAINPFYSSVNGVLFSKGQTTLIQYTGAKAGIYTIPNSVINIANAAFAGSYGLTSIVIPPSVQNIGIEAFNYCAGLTSITIPNSITSIGYETFAYCYRLTNVYFQGNAPSIGSSVFYAASRVIVYYLPGTTGWGSTFADRPTVLWNPQIQTNDGSFGVRTNQFGGAMTL